MASFMNLILNLWLIVSGKEVIQKSTDFNMRATSILVNIDWTSIVIKEPLCAKTSLGYEHKNESSSSRSQ